MGKYIAVSSALSLTLYGAFYWKIPGSVNYHPLFPNILVFYFIQSLIVSRILVLGEQDRSRLAWYAIAALSLRLGTAVFFLVALALLETEHLQPLTIQFTVVYLFYLAFELTLLLSNLRTHSGNKLSQ